MKLLRKKTLCRRFFITSYGYKNIAKKRPREDAKEVWEVKVCLELKPRGIARFN